MLIERTAADMWGGATVEAGSPASQLATDVYYTPHIENGRWGLFDRDDRILPSLVEWWLPERLPLRQEPASPLQYNHIQETLPDDDYLYGGRYVNHFGH